MIKTAIVILNWNGLKFLQMFLGKVVEYSLDDQTEIFVADNGSTDDSVSWLKDNYPLISLINLKKNHGFAGAYNIALNQIDAKYYVLLNTDIEVTEGWLQPLVEFMDKNIDVASCQPKILSYNSKAQFEYAGAGGGFIDKYGYPFCRGRIFNNVEEEKGQYDDSIDIFWSSGACMVTRRVAWEKCSGFDDDFFAHMEEIDLCWRFQKNGYRNSYVGSSVVYHVGGGTLPYDSPFKTYLNFRNSLFLLYKNLPDSGFHSTLFIRKLLDGIAALVFLLRGKPGSFLSVIKAHIHYYKSLKSLKNKRNSLKSDKLNTSLTTILNKSLVFEFYLKGRKTYKAIIDN